MAPFTTRKARRTAARLRKAAHYERIAWRRARSIVKGQVLYESFAGNGMLDNPEAIFTALLDAPEFAHLTHVWVLKDLVAYRSTVQRFDRNPRVRFVTYGSDKYFEALARSEYLVNNATFPPEFGKREGQVYVNTWHGTPLKHMGYDIPGGGPVTRNILRNFVNADFLLSANEFMTKSMYESAYKLRGVYRGSIIQEGSPRVDRQFLSDSERQKVRAELVQRGVSLDAGQEIVLYAPTWRGSFYAPLNDVIQLANRIRKLNQQIDSKRHRVLLKVHQVVYDFAAAQPELKGMLVPNDIPTNVMLGASDVLITDYSSIFFDFLATGRPVLFHLPDEKTYSDVRGLYIPVADLPGPASRTVDELAAQLRSLGDGTPGDPLHSHAETYASARQEYSAQEDGNATKRIIDVVFRGRTEGYDVRDDFTDSRTSILIYLGGMRPNGITNSVLNLMDNIDHERFDVSAFYAHSRSRERLGTEALINPNVRLFPRLGGINGTKLLWFGRKTMLAKGMDSVSSLQRPGLIRALRDEWVRCFGSSKFDHIVDFSGYSPFWMYVMQQGQARTQSVFLHNDLMAETRREVNGRFPHERNLLSTFETYRNVDNLISVSSALADINREKLSAYASPEKFVSAENTINYQYVLRMAHGLRRNDAPALTAGDSVRTVDIADLPGAIESLMDGHTLTAIIEEATRKDTIEQLVPDSRGGVTFVTAGRLSPEKNQTRLIEAFDLVHRDNPETHLVILGSGPLAGALRNRIVELGLVTAVTLAGHQQNPYGVMAKSDCFVLSSDYEGQPMVLLEAMVLGLPIVTTDFASVSGALPEGSGYITPSTVEGLAEGMRAFLEGRVPSPPFDYVAYNQNAVEQFYRAIGAAAPDLRPTAENASTEPTSIDLDSSNHQDRSITL